MGAKKTNDVQRAHCPIALSLEVFGDRWTLLILRDMMLGGRRHFREFLRSPEGISSNILADRLARLQDDGIITRADDPTHSQKGVFSLTEKGIQLVPVLVQIASWGRRHLPGSGAAVRTALLEEGGPRVVEAFMDELRETHLGVPPKRSRSKTASVASRLRAAYERVLTQSAQSAD
jgi:DNA-binding HxlR family transcriptional regulator